MLLISTFFVGCSGKDTAKTPSNTGTISKPETAKNPSGDNRLSDPKGSIAYQFELLKAGDFDKFKECFTDRIKGRLTKEMVDEAKGKMSDVTMEDLFSSSQEGEYEGKKTVKVKMKNGRTLTTLVQTDGKWLADTIWFN